MGSLLETLAGTGELGQVTPVTSPPRAPEKKLSERAIEVIPYNACYDPMADKLLPWLWKRMQDDDLVDFYFPGQRDTGFATFVRMFSGDAQVALFKITNPTEDSLDATLPGFITWNPMPMGASNMIIAGFIFFKRWWDHHTTDEAARAAFDAWFKQEPRIDAVLGSCPALHLTAMRYNKRIGLREVGRLPSAHLYKGERCDAVLYCLTREEYMRCQQR